MSSGQTGFYRGTSTDQVSYFRDKEKDALDTRNWPPIFLKLVDFSKVDMTMVQQWIEKSVEEVLGHEDDIVSDMTFTTLELAAEAQKKDSLTKGKDGDFDARKLALSLEGFMGDDIEGPTQAMKFVHKLMNLLLESQEQKANALLANSTASASTQRLAEELELVKTKAAAIAAGIADKVEGRGRDNSENRTVVDTTTSTINSTNDGHNSTTFDDGNAMYSSANASTANGTANNSREYRRESPPRQRRHHSRDRDRDDSTNRHRSRSPSYSNYRDRDRYDRRRSPSPSRGNDSYWKNRRSGPSGGGDNSARNHRYDEPTGSRRRGIDRDNYASNSSHHRDNGTYYRNGNNGGSGSVNSTDDYKHNNRQENNNNRQENRRRDNSLNNKKDTEDYRSKSNRQDYNNTTRNRGTSLSSSSRRGGSGNYRRNRSRSRSRSRSPIQDRVSTTSGIDEHRSIIIDDDVREGEGGDADKESQLLKGITPDVLEVPREENNGPMRAFPE